jgi:hypothetical protein
MSPEEMDAVVDAELAKPLQTDNLLAFHLPEPPQWLVYFSAGVGDTASFGLSAYIRDQWGIGSVDFDSDAYGNGRIAGAPLTVGTLAAGGVFVNVGIRAAGGANTLYHFTTASNAASIARSGVLRPGPNILWGPGPYATAFPSPLMTGSASTQSVITINGMAGRAIATPWPGTFRFGGPVPIR